MVPDLDLGDLDRDLVPNLRINMMTILLVGLVANRGKTMIRHLMQKEGVIIILICNWQRKS